MIPLGMMLLVSFACTELLDEIDSDITFDEGILDLDTTGSMEPSNVNRLGLFYTQSELDVWKERAENGPFKSKGDAGKNTPNDWERIIKSANKFLDNPKKELWFGNIEPEPHSLAHGIKDASFVYAVTGDNKYLGPIKEVLLAQIRTKEAEVDHVGFTHEKGFHTASWALRLLYAYDYTKDQFSESEKKEIKNWFEHTAYHFATRTNNQLSGYFPNRLSNDYSVRKSTAKSGDGEKGSLTHVASNGKKGNEIRYIHKVFNNRKSSQIKLVGLVGVAFKNDELIKHAKCFVKETLMFSTFPDGTMAEYNRNGDYGVPQMGMLYSATNIEALILIADALARTGDFELYDYETSEGIWGTEGGNKSIKLLIENYYKQVAGINERFYNSAKKENKLDAIHDQQGKQWISDIWFSMANRYYRSEFFQDVYMHRHPNAPEFQGSKLGTSGPIANAWSGSASTMPGYLFMFGEMEDEESPYPSSRN